ncbi:MAG: LPXTG cell wall anchor domain-containing protein [Euryarchaeota archaeon]|nr:LPXTG cell wall anchor domain-containing protein [Euryarchaeota archaeon]
MDYFEMGTEERINKFSAVSAQGTELGYEILPHSLRINFEKPLNKGENYAFRIDFSDVEPRYLEENTLYYKSFSFPKDVKKFNFIMRLPEGMLPDVSTHNLACVQNCTCKEGGSCICEECVGCLTCTVTAWKSTTTTPPNDISIENKRVTLVWAKTLKANEKFDIGLIYPETGLDQYWYLLPIVGVSVATFSFGFFLAWKKRKKDIVHVFLTDEEKSVVDFIKSGGGEVLQENIWKEETLSFSRPKVSRIIADLEGRGILKREPYKKTFKVSLVRY